MEKNSHLEWKQLDVKVANDFRIFKACLVLSAAPDGREKKFVRLDSPDWINVVCVVKKDGEDAFLMVRQYRHGSGTVTMEFPAGLVNKGEAPAVAAKRELLEETGYIADDLVLIGTANPDPAFMNNTSYTYFAVNPVKTEKQSLDEDEMIDVYTIPVREYEKNMGKGEYINAISLLAYFWYKNHIKK